MPPVTTMENLGTRCEIIMLADLPPIFQDAISITRRLGCRYLWIDRLCIIQDSVSDWQMELAKMAEIYSNAVLNISADTVADSYEGIFKSANKAVTAIGWGNCPDIAVQLPVQCPSRGISTVYTPVYHGTPLPDEGSILQKRAWAFQGAVLSRRRPRYTIQGMFWRCCSLWCMYMGCNPF